ncbi:hypothetical protein SNE40_015662 [Patella caerulea]|uniref:Uncharacterized protein n=1 Tax=Patella caerulea TaxID=87958 RepID=A0AAN8JKD4_PATCE
MVVDIELAVNEGRMTAYSFKGLTKSQKKGSGLPIPLLTVFGSAVIWILVVIFAYLFYVYFFLFLRIYDDSDLDVPCENKLSVYHDSDFIQKHNLNRVMNYPVGDSLPYLKSFGFKESDFRTATQPEQKLPRIVTAVDSSQFYQVQGLIRHLAEDVNSVGDVYLIIYDIGLNPGQALLLMNQCNCIVRRFHFEAYPDHVTDISNFAWRPLIIQAVLEETGSVLYIEPTTRFKSSNSLELFRKRGTRHFYLWDEETFSSVVGYTDKGMFDFLEEKRCEFVDTGLISTEIMVFYKTNITWNSILRPWLACAFNQNCIAPQGARSDYCFHIRHPRTTGCHMFDQSAISIITNRVFQITADRKKMIPPRITYYSAQEETYFQDQPWTNRQIIAIICSPIIVYIIYRQRRRRYRF